jgi:hypothetical protein
MKGKQEVRPIDSLPGLERFLLVSRTHGFLSKEEPPAQVDFASGMLIAGQPCDPLLAAVHARIGHLFMDEGFFLLRLVDPQRFDLFTVNEEWRRDWPEPIRSLLIFAKENALAYYYATVPQLKSKEGLQPVVRIVTYEEPYALPLASDINWFFETYSRYLEALVLAPYYEEEGPAALAFPWQVPELIGRDKPLVEMLRAGRFDFLMPKDEETRAWVAQVVGAAV